MSFRTIHRVLALFVLAFTLYLSTTGSLIEMTDVRTMIVNPSPFDPNLMAMREDFDGPPSFRVLRTADYVAPPLPGDTDMSASFARLLHAARTTLGNAGLQYAELRMQGGQPVGIIQAGTATLAFNAATGAALGAPPAPMAENQPPASFRNTIKHLHRMTTFGNWALWINIFASASLVILIVTGLWVYTRMLLARSATGRSNPFWFAGGWWRALHRVISLVTVLFLSIVTLSGAWLAVESLVFGMYLSHHQMAPPPGEPSGSLANEPAPLPDAYVQPMLATTLAAYHAAMPGVPARVVRLRYFGGMPQGVVVSGGATAEQLVFNAHTGQRASLTEPGYPTTGFPFGWQAHQTAKAIHRGSYFGITGRVMSILAGLSMLYLSVSGLVLYATLWSRRRRIGRPALIWN